MLKALVRQIVYAAVPYRFISWHAYDARDVGFLGYYSFAGQLIAFLRPDGSKLFGW